MDMLELVRNVKPTAGDRVGWVDWTGVDCTGTFLHTIPGDRVMVVMDLGFTGSLCRVELLAAQIWSEAWIG